MSDTEKVIAGLNFIIRKYGFMTAGEIQDIARAVALLKEQEPIDGDTISRAALLAAYDAAHKGPPGGARKLIEEAPVVTLKEQEPRVMTLKELAYYDSSVYVETHNGCPEGLTEELWLALGHLYCVSQNGKHGYVSFVNTNADTYDFEAADYNVLFRCWTSRPTNEQREAVKWG